jgi:2-polyprenyl-3-methyl-5-hydroxy-6-metoxy-1,4-benzoquinol methylase
MNDVAEWEAIHKSRMWGTYPDIHVVRQVRKFMALPRWAAEVAKLPTNDRIVWPEALDIGCGVGACTGMMAEQGMWVTAVDGSETAIKKMGDRGVSVEAMVADAQTVEFPANSFDFILDNFTLTNIEHPPWERILSWLKPGGWLVHASFEVSPQGSPRTWEHKEPGAVVERHSSWVEGNAFSFAVRRYIKPS